VVFKDGPNLRYKAELPIVEFFELVADAA